MKRMILAGLAGLSMVVAASAPAQAAPVMLTTVISNFSGNDCAGVFQFDTVCDVGYGLDPRQDISPIIAKYDLNTEGDGGEWTFYDEFSTIAGTEFGGGFLTSDASSGSWTYTPDVGDPAIRFWVAKGGNAFNLFWNVDAAELEVGGACAGSNVYTAECLQKAISVTGGSFWTPEQKGLSHLSFYDSEPVTGGDRGGNIPEPTALALFGAALALVGSRLRRRT